MKKIVRVLAVLVCWMLCVIKVKADVIWEPYNDDFYTENRENCQYINRNYIADGPDNQVIVYKDPENPGVTQTLENGDVVNICYTWTDESGIAWGMYHNWETDEIGWVPMTYMDVEYDNICFEEEFGDSIVEEAIGIPGEYVNRNIFFWSYPGAENYLEVLMPEDESSMPQCSKTFVDEEGHKWGYIGYFHGIRDSWVCFDNPVADVNILYQEGLPLRGKQISEENTISEENIVSDENTNSEKDTASENERISPPVDGGKIALIICLVLGTCGATGGVLMKMKKKG